MNAAEALGKVFFMLALVLGVAFLASVDPNNSLPDAGIPISLDDLAVESLLSDVPRINPFTIPETDPGNRTLLTAGIPVIEGLENFFRGIAEGLTGAAYVMVNAFIFVINILIAVGWLIGKLIATLTTIIRFDLWPAFQIHPMTQVLGIVLTVGLVGTIAVLMLLLILKVVSSIPIPGA